MNYWGQNSNCGQIELGRSTERKENAIVVCCNGKWLPFAGAALFSCLGNISGDSVDMFVVVHEATLKQIYEFKAFLKLKKIEATVVETDLRTELHNLKTERFSTATLLRLSLDQLIPRTYSRLLYLDCDVLVQSPLVDVFKLDMGDKIIAATQDYISLIGPVRRMADHSFDIGLKKSTPYFNAGVILFDWQKTINEKVLPNCIARLVESERAGQSFLYIDQDVLNLEFAGRWLDFGARYNAMTFMLPFAKTIPVVRHFNSRNKPWGDTWIPKIAGHKSFYTSLMDGTSYQGAIACRFKRISLNEVKEYWVRRFNQAVGLRKGQSLW